MRRILFCPLFAVVCNLLLAFVVYQIARVCYLLDNWSYFSAGLSWELWRGGLVFDTSAILVTNALYIVLMLLPVHWKEQWAWWRQLCKWLFVVVNTLSLVLCLADAAYFPYTMRRTTTTVFSEFQNETNLAAVVLTEAMRHWYFVVLAVLVAVGLSVLYRHPAGQSPQAAGQSPQTTGQSPQTTGQSPQTAGQSPQTAGQSPQAAGQHSPVGSGRPSAGVWPYYLTQFLSLAIAVPLSVAGIRGGFTTAVRPVTISNASQYVDRPLDAALVLNTPFSLYRTIGKNVFSVPRYFASEEELAAVYSPEHWPAGAAGSDGSAGTAGSNGFSGTDGSAGTVAGRQQPKNVVVLIVESFGREYIGALNCDLEDGRYQGYTPCVDSLIGLSTTFRWSFCNGRKSIDGMPSILSGIPMFVEPFFLTPASMNEVSGLAGLLARKDYETAFFHGAQRGSMGFQAFARKTGFQHYYGREDYEEDPRFGGRDDFDGMWAVWDEPFLQYYCTMMSDMHQPFMTAVFTASSHHPFKVPEQYRGVYPDEGIAIHKCIRYTDMALGRFFQSAKSQPWFQHTIFVLTSDHTNLSDHACYQTDLGGFCSPVIIYEPGDTTRLKGEIQPKIAQQTDILPTVLGLVGYDEPYVAFGIDLLHSDPADTWAVNYLGGIYQYVKHGYVLQFDGERTRAVYALTDSLMEHNLVHGGPSHAVLPSVGHSPAGAPGQAQQQQMERELKAIIQQYMTRMAEDRLTIR